MSRLLTSQLIWHGTLNVIPVRVTGSCSIEGISKVVVPATTLKCIGALVDVNNKDVQPCSRCMSMGMSSPLSYLTWMIEDTGGTHHGLKYDVVVLCNGSIGHLPRDVYMVAMCTL